MRWLALLVVGPALAGCLVDAPEDAIAIHGFDATYSPDGTPKHTWRLVLDGPFPVVDAHGQTVAAYALTEHHALDPSAPPHAVYWLDGRLRLIRVDTDCSLPSPDCAPGTVRYGERGGPAPYGVGADGSGGPYSYLGHPVRDVVDAGRVDASAWPMVPASGAYRHDGIVPVEMEVARPGHPDGPMALRLVTVRDLGPLGSADAMAPEPAGQEPASDHPLDDTPLSATSWSGRAILEAIAQERPEVADGVQDGCITWFAWHPEAGSRGGLVSPDDPSAATVHHAELTTSDRAEGGLRIEESALQERVEVTGAGQGGGDVCPTTASWTIGDMQALAARIDAGPLRSIHYITSQDDAAPVSSAILSASFGAGSSGLHVVVHADTGAWHALSGPAEAVAATLVL